MNSFAALTRKQEVLDSKIEAVRERAEGNFPSDAPPGPNKYHRRVLIEKQVEESLFSPDIHDLNRSVTKSYAKPEYVRQLIESEDKSNIKN